jgi:hypothetical protein
MGRLTLPQPFFLGGVPTEGEGREGNLQANPLARRSELAIELTLGCFFFRGEGGLCGFHNGTCPLSNM